MFLLVAMVMAAQPSVDVFKDASSYFTSLLKIRKLLQPWELPPSQAFL